VTCEECRELLQDLVDNELPSTVRGAVETHLKSCAACDAQYRDLAKFTTSLVKAVRPLKPSAEFSSKVLATYEGTKAQLKVAPPPTAARAFAVWPFAVGIAVLVLAGLLALFWPSGGEALGRVARNPSQARVLAFTSGGWREVDSRGPLLSGYRIKAEPGNSGTDQTSGLSPKFPVVALDLKPCGEAWLLAPCAAQLERTPDRVTLRLLQEAPGRVRLKTPGAPPASGVRALRVLFGSAWVEVACGEKNSVDVEGNPTTGELTVAVQSGAARLGNTGASQAVAEGFTIRVPQSGACSEAAKVQPGAFDWAEKEN
jgi:hypothetical protein